MQQKIGFYDSRQKVGFEEMKAVILFISHVGLYSRFLFDSFFPPFPSCFFPFLSPRKVFVSDFSFRAAPSRGDSRSVSPNGSLHANETESKLGSHVSVVSSTEGGIVFFSVAGVAIGRGFYRSEISQVTTPRL